MKKIRVLVFPCGSEIGLEIFRSLEHSTHIELYGGSSIDDHGSFVYKNYIDQIPFVDSPDFVKKIQHVVKINKIDAVYPAMDKVIWKLKHNESVVGCKVISSPKETTDICLSKRKTYAVLEKTIKVPKVFERTEKINKYPVFVKPDIGYGSRGVFLARDKEQLVSFLTEKNINEYVLCEHLTGDEFTIDCFTDRHGDLLFAGPRIRNRISNGISVNTKPTQYKNIEFRELAHRINESLDLKGAWFFQVKEDSSGELTLLEVACRLGGSSALYRVLGVNFALLSIFDAFDNKVDIITNDFGLQLDRALDNRYKASLDYSKVYVDFDDCILQSAKLNTKLLSFLFQCVNERKKIILITKHDKDIFKTLEYYRILSLFDNVISLNKNDKKSMHIDKNGSIFIDDSFAERKEVYSKLQIPVFAPDAVELLLK